MTTQADERVAIAGLRLPVREGDGGVGTATVRSMEPVLSPLKGSLDVESRDWLRDLRARGPEHDEAVARLHALLLRGARFEVARRRPIMPHLRGNDLDDIAQQAADDALMGVLRRLDDFRGASRFSTWVFKFAIYETAVKLRKRSWQGREVPLEPDAWDVFASASAEPAAEAEQRELVETLETAIANELTPHQRRVLVAIAINGVPIDVLAERLSTNRNALYKTLHDARRKLRNHLTERGLTLTDLEDQ